ncbi:hypothetical protein RUM44_010091 [Polyplax serrata]|uniref:Uncharacterized protein n=1 Tax=Polyplax serrata TaxID=468196 RepID=A0ABR1AUJ0_POLSC
MEIHGPDKFCELLEEKWKTNIDKLFPLAQKCMACSSNEIEVLRALEITFEFGLKVLSLDAVEDGMLQYAGPAAKKIFLRQIESLENQNDHCTLEDFTSNYSQFLTVCEGILSCFNQFYGQLNEFHQVNISQVESVLLSTTEILYRFFCHCNISEQIYGSHFNSVTKHLTLCYKKSCEVLELLLDLLASRLKCNFEEAREITILCDILKSLGKFGFVLMNLDVKTMAKVWKTHVCLVEKHFHYIKESFSISEIINCLSKDISTSIKNGLLATEEDQDLVRTIKLACFNLKLVIKFCDIFRGLIGDCEESLSDLLLMLCRCNFVPSVGGICQSDAHKDLLKQLSCGAEPLLSHLMKDESIINGLVVMNGSMYQKLDETANFLILCCSILKKLMYADTATRNLWLNNKINILDWVFDLISYDKYNICSKMQVTDVLLEEKQKRIVDMYQHVLVIVSSFVITSTSDEFYLVEKTLIQKVLQPEPLTALLAIDVWCVVARFSDADLCFQQIFKLFKILKGFHCDTVRSEKCFLMCLIQRLFPLLTNAQREETIKSFQLESPSWLLKIHKFYKGNHDFNIYLMHNINNTFMCHIEKYLYWEETCIQGYLESDHSTKLQSTFERLIYKLWKFNPKCMTRCEHNNYFKMASLITLDALPHISSKTLLRITSKMKKLICNSFFDSGLYFTWLLKSLSMVTFPSDNIQRSIIDTIAEIFGTLLSSENMWVKQKALDNFYNFSHFTSHPEIVVLSVKNSPTLKLDVTNYFKRIISEDVSDVSTYISKLCKVNFIHVCNEQESGSKEILGKNLNNVDFEEVYQRWKADSETLRHSMNNLTSLQKKEIGMICTILLDISL